jgi:hypothetical protein
VNWRAKKHSGNPESAQRLLDHGQGDVHSLPQSFPRINQRERLSTPFFILAAASRHKSTSLVKRRQSIYDIQLQRANSR